MKNAKAYERKFRKLLSGMARGKSPAAVKPEDRITVLLTAILEENSTAEDAERALEALRQEYVDFNELRVSPLKEIIERVGREYPQIRAKALTINLAMNAVFNKTCTLMMDYMDKMAKRDLRRHLQEIGLSLFASAMVVLRLFDGHAIPVDKDLVECLQMEQYAHEESDVLDVQGFLERVIPQKDDWSAHEFFRKYIQKNAKALGAKRRAEAKIRAEAEKKRLEEEAAARAEAERKAAEDEARRKAREEAAAAKEAVRLAKQAVLAAARKKAEKAKAKAAKKATKASKPARKAEKK